MNWSATCVERSPGTDQDVHSLMMQGTLGGSVLTFVVCGAFLSLNVALRCNRYAVSDRLRQCYSFGTFEHDVALSVSERCNRRSGVLAHFFVCRPFAVMLQVLLLHVLASALRRQNVVFFCSLEASLRCSPVCARHVLCCRHYALCSRLCFGLAPARVFGCTTTTFPFAGRRRLRHNSCSSPR